eukprot:g15887.t1
MDGPWKESFSLRNARTAVESWQHCHFMGTITEALFQFQFFLTDLKLYQNCPNSGILARFPYLSKFSLCASNRQSFPLLFGASRLVQIFCLMEKGILKALGPTRVVTPLSGSSSKLLTG